MLHANIDTLYKQRGVIGVARGKREVRTITSNEISVAIVTAQQQREEKKQLLK